jgi:outer membrane biosynthesis protein TonB
MRIVGRYFATGATLGSIGGLVALVLIWSWMTLHLGLFGFLVGWIPAGLVAAAVWITMVVFWAPILVLSTVIGMIVLALGDHHDRERDWAAPPAARPPEEAPAPTDQAPTDEAPPHDAPPPAEAAPEPPPPDVVPPAPPRADIPAPAAPPVLSAQPPPAPPSEAPPRKARPTDDLGGDAAAAGDTSRSRPQ